MYPASAAGDRFGINRIKELVQTLNPDVVFCVQDLWIQAKYLRALRGCSPLPKIILYSPVDAPPVDPEWLEDIECVSRLVVYTEFARREVQHALQRKPAPPIEVIPHGVDQKIFYPLLTHEDGRDDVSSTIEAKRRLQLFTDDELHESFIVLNAHRNQPRKRIDITLKAFAHFVRNKPDAVQLYLHMKHEDVGWNVLKLAQRYGIDHRLILTQPANMVSGILSEQLNLIYNACDVGVNSATGEGWGLPNFEHGAAGKAQIVPRFGALEEIWSECAEFVEPTSEVVYERLLTEGKVVSVEDLAAALETLYHNHSRRRAVAEACYRRATDSRFTWKTIAGRWHQIFTGLS